jgi:hypothetical protein
VAPRERVRRVDVGVAGGAERGGVGAVRDGDGGVFTDLAEADARMARHAGVTEAARAMVSFHGSDPAWREGVDYHV